MKWEYTSFSEYNYECKEEETVCYFSATNVIRDEYISRGVPENLENEEDIKKYYYSANECLDLHGMDGWELVSVVYKSKVASLQTGGTGGGSYDEETVFYLKRPFDPKQGQKIF